MPRVDSPAFSSAAWSELLTRELGRPVDVSFGRARRNVIVMHPRGPRLGVRMNTIFADAPPPVRSAVVKWLRSGRRARRACRELDEWIEGVMEELAAQGPPRFRLQPRGECHDLDKIAAELFEAEFASPSQLLNHAPRITWGRRGRSSSRYSLQLGSFDPVQDVIRIHSVLDQPAVPHFFVRFVLFHELLHAELPAERAGSGRRRHHGPEFQRRERLYADFARALEWQENHLSALIRSARSGRSIKLPREKPQRQGFLFPV